MPFEISLKEAINKGMLVPFHYYGIYDETIDYSHLHTVRGKYMEEEVNAIYIDNVRRYNLIYKYYQKYCSNRALGFFYSIIHSEEIGGKYFMERNIAIEKLKIGEIKVIFSVDMFNEGVDMVMFLRPTESPVVFMQQLGRGLRRSKGKEYLNVLDFIGNYEKAGSVRSLLTGKSSVAYRPSDQSAFPDGCMIDFDMKLIDLFAEHDKKSMKVSEQIRREYYRIKEYLGTRPSRMELFTYMDEDIYQMTIAHPKTNLFKRYLEYLKELEELTEAEEKFCQRIGKEFISYWKIRLCLRYIKCRCLWHFIIMEIFV